MVLLGAAAAANWTATFHAVTSQPNWVTVDQATPWAALAPHTGGGQAVAAGPARILAILVACGCALVAGRRWRAARGSRWSQDTLGEVLWWTAVALGLRSVFEPVMVAYYLWPALAVALIAASRSWSRLIPASAAAVGAHPRVAADLAGRVELVDPDDRWAGADPVLRPEPGRHPKSYRRPPASPGRAGRIRRAAGSGRGVNYGDRMARVNGPFGHKPRVEQSPTS